MHVNNYITAGVHAEEALARQGTYVRQRRIYVMRINIGRPRSILKQALERLEKVVKEL